MTPQPAADLLAIPTEDAEEAALELAEREWWAKNSDEWEEM